MMSNGPATVAAELDSLQQAFQLHQLAHNATLLEFGLKAGLIEQTESGRYTIELLNANPMGPGAVLRCLAIEIVMRLGIFIPATNLVKIALESQENGPNYDRSNVTRWIYIISMVMHQIWSLDEVTIRAVNRWLMCTAIIFFCSASINTRSLPCKDMNKFRSRFGARLWFDYYLWCLVLAMDFTITYSWPILINVENAYGVLVHTFHLTLSVFCVRQLSYSMRIIGFGRLTPLIVGTPLLFLDAGYDLTPLKGLQLMLYYFAFWLSDWNEIVDWNHKLLCQAGVCKILSTEKGNMNQISEKAKHKFDDWRMEEGLDDDGWVILLHRRRRDDSSMPATRPATGSEGHEPADPAQYDTTSEGGHERDDDDSRSSEIDAELETDEGEISDAPDEDDWLHRNRPDQLVYLNSRNPLLTSFAVFMLKLWS